MVELGIMIACIVFVVLGMFLGWLTAPLVLFLRARRDASWDKSNITNMYRVVGHIATHPGDFAKMRYPDGRNPFHYLGGDEFSDNMNTRPKDYAE